MEIETLFACLKGQGFCFEETRMTKLKRIEKLVSVLALAFVWPKKRMIGDTLKKPIKTKKTWQTGYQLLQVWT